MTNIYAINSGHLVIEVKDTFRVDEARELAARILREADRAEAVGRIFDDPLKQAIDSIQAAEEEL